MCLAFLGPNSHPQSNKSSFYSFWLQKNLRETLPFAPEMCQRYHLRYAQYWISGYPKRWYSSHSLLIDTDFFLPISTSSTLREPAMCKSIFHEAWLSIQRPGGSNSPAHTCSACPLSLCCAPWSPGCNGFWMFPERREHYRPNSRTLNWIYKPKLMQ